VAAGLKIGLRSKRRKSLKRFLSSILLVNMGLKAVKVPRVVRALKELTVPKAHRVSRVVRALKELTVSKAHRVSRVLLELTVPKAHRASRVPRVLLALKELAVSRVAKVLKRYWLTILSLSMLSSAMILMALPRI
jgi:hypothetical protein